MIITESYNLVNKELVNKGLFKIVPIAIILDCYCTEEEKEQNRNAAEHLTSEEWTKRCLDFAETIGNRIHKIVTELSEMVWIGQFNNSDITLDNCDVWFWCNVTDNGRDYSHIRLEFPDKKNYEKNEKICERIRSFLTGIEAQNVQAIIQYGTIHNEDKIRKEAFRIYSENENKFVKYYGMDGKLLKTTENGYAWKKKGAKTKCYVLSPLDVCARITVE